MPKGKANQDIETLEMALIGFEQKKVEIEEKIHQIKSMLGSGSSASPKKSAAPKAAEDLAPVRKKRTLSAAARKRIALAQKKRWAEHRKSQTEQAK
jgi:hypothetical protein